MRGELGKLFEFNLVDFINMMFDFLVKIHEISIDH